MSKIVTRENFKVGDKVIKGRDWSWEDQGKNSDYGVITEEYLRGWVAVDWYKDGNVIDRAGYRVEAEGKYDLYFYDDSMLRTLDGKLKITL